MTECNISQDVNIFFLETELQCLAYKNIRSYIGEKSHYVVLSTLKSVNDHLLALGKNPYYLDKECHGWFGRLKKLRKNLKISRLSIESIVRTPSVINYHTSRIDGLFSNLLINYLRHHFPSAKINVRLIPDGAINIFSTTIGNKKLIRLKRWSNDIAVRFFHDMKITMLAGDELGADSEEVDRIYCFEGIDSHYDPKKIVRIPIISNIEKGGSNNGINSSKALVIGQNFLELETASPQYVHKVGKKIENLIDKENINGVDYIPHPRSTEKEFWSPNYNCPENKWLCVEELILNGAYTHIYSCYSSALINSKVIMGGDVKVVSVGLEQFPFRSAKQLQQLRAAFLRAGIELKPIDKTMLPFHKNLKLV